MKDNEVSFGTYYYRYYYKSKNLHRLSQAKWDEFHLGACEMMCCISTSEDIPGFPDAWDKYVFGDWCSGVIFKSRICVGEVYGERPLDERSFWDVLDEGIKELETSFHNLFEKIVRDYFLGSQEKRIISLIHKKKKV